MHFIREFLGLLALVGLAGTIMNYIGKTFHKYLQTKNEVDSRLKK
ncbi:hypothetical protein [Streptobacillus canis]|nr:hypothetical protein [Streptobacillus canis]